MQAHAAVMLVLEVQAPSVETAAATDFAEGLLTQVRSMKTLEEGQLHEKPLQNVAQARGGWPGALTALLDSSDKGRFGRCAARYTAGEEAINTLFSPCQEKFHTFVLRGVRNVSEAL